MHQDSISHDILIFWNSFNGSKNTFVYQIKKFVSSFFKVYPNCFLYLHTFLSKTPWKLYDPFIKFRLQIYVKNELPAYFKIFFSVFVKHFWKNYWDAPSGAPACSPWLYDSIQEIKQTICEKSHVYSYIDQKIFWFVGWNK